MRALPALAVRNFITFTMLYLGAVGLGLFSLSRLPVDMYPDITFPLIGIVTTYEGASPEDIENLITRPVEEAVTAVEGVEEVTSASRHGVSRVFVEFDWGTDLDQAEMDVRRNLDFLDDVIPDDASKPLVFAFNPSLQPINVMAVYGPFDQAQLRRISERQLEPRLERLPGVAQADTIGGLVREIQVRFDPDQLLARGIALDQVVAALRAENVQLPGGTVREGGRETAIVTQGHFETVDQIRDVVVGVPGGVPVRLRDVADVEDTFEEQTHIVRNNGRSAVILLVRKQSDANTVETSRAVEEALPEILDAMPAGLRIGVIFDQSSFIRASVSNLSGTGLFACFITFLVLLAFLRDVRGSAVVGLSVPVSLIVTLAVMYAMDITLNMISMAGLALAIGMLVDNSIVVLENVYRHHADLGKPPRQAAIEGTQEVVMAITASTLTTIAVFGPILFVEGVAGVMFRDMAITICFSLLASLLVAVTLVPMLASRLLRSRDSVAPGRRRSLVWRAFREVALVAALLLAASVARSGGIAPPIVGRWLSPGAGWSALAALVWLVVLAARARAVSARLGGAVERGYELLARTHRALLGWSLARPRTTILGFVATFVVALVVLFGLVETDFFPKHDDSMVFLRLDAALGSSAQQTDRYYRQAEAIIERNVPERLEVATEVGQGAGFMSLFGQGLHSGLIRLKLKPLEERERSAQEIEEALRKKIRRIPGATLTVFQPFSFAGGADVEIEIFGHDLEVARSVGQEIKAMVSADRDLRDAEFSMDEGSPQLEVTLDRERMSALGINSLAVNRTVSIFFQGSTASIFREGDDEFDIRVRAPAALRRSRRQIEDLRLLTPLGKQVPLGTIARVDERLGPVEISRKDQQRFVTVSANSVGSDLGGVVDRLTRQLDAHRFPDDFAYRLGGAAEDMRESFQQLAFALLAAVLLVYMVMASQFESLLSPFIVFLTVPLTALGISLGLFTTGTPLSVVAVIGIIMLGGVVVNNSIVLVDFANQRMDTGGLGVGEAAAEAARTRLRPILMTALTTVLGMAPLASGAGSGGQSWAPMARVVIGGLAWSTIVTLVFVPVIYRSMARHRRKPVEEGAA